MMKTFFELIGPIRSTQKLTLITQTIIFYMNGIDINLVGSKRKLLLNKTTIICYYRRFYNCKSACASTVLDIKQSSAKLWSRFPKRYDIRYEIAVTENRIAPQTFEMEQNLTKFNEAIQGI